MINNCFDTFCTLLATFFCLPYYVDNLRLAECLPTGRLGQWILKGFFILLSVVAWSEVDVEVDLALLFMRCFLFGGALVFDSFAFWELTKLCMS